MTWKRFIEMINNSKETVTISKSMAGELLDDYDILLKTLHETELLLKSAIESLENGDI